MKFKFWTSNRQFFTNQHKIIYIRKHFRNVVYDIIKHRVKLHNANSYHFFKKMLNDFEKTFETKNEISFKIIEFFNFKFFMNKNEIFEQFFARFIALTISLKLFDVIKIDQMKMKIIERMRYKMNLKHIIVWKEFVQKCRNIWQNIQDLNVYKIAKSNTTSKFFKTIINIRKRRRSKNRTTIVFKKRIDFRIFKKHVYNFYRFSNHVVNKIKIEKRCFKCLKKRHKFTNKNAFCKNQKSVNKNNAIIVLTKINIEWDDEKIEQKKIHELFQLFVHSIRIEKLKVFEISRFQKLCKEMRKKIKKLKHFIDSHLVTIKLSSINLNVYIFEIRNKRQLNFDAKIEIVKKFKKTYFLTNIDVFASEFVDINFVKQHKLFTMLFKNFIKLRLVDNNLTFNITRMTLMKFQLKNHVIELWCLIISLKKFDLILDMSWLKQHDSHVFFKKKFLTFNSNYCLKHCIYNYKFTTIYNKKIKKFLEFKSPINQTDIAEITITVFTKMTTKKKNNVMMMWSKHFEQLNRFEKKDRYLLINNLIANITIISTNDYHKFFNKIAKKSIIKKKLRTRMLECFHRYINRWNSINVNKLFSHRKWNHFIKLKSEFSSLVKKIYELSREQILIMKKYIDDMLEKEFIRSNNFEYVVSIFIVKKLEKKLRVCVDYRTLNVLIIKNRNASFLIRDTLIRLCKIKIYNKFDIITTFNEIRMKKRNEKKIVFFIRYDLFEYVMMFFDLCNALDTFQVFINNILRKYLNDFINVFLNDILMYNENKKKHIEHVTKILVKLKKVNLFLDIDKCEFFVISIKYLNFIIITKKIRMNFKKIEIIVNWKFFKCIKNVQVFLNFVNFYRKFIFDYSRIALFLNKLIRISEKKFVFSWNSNEFEKTTFNVLKQTFTTTSILQHFDSNLETWIETDASNFVVVAILFQRDVDDQLHSIVFMSKKMNSIECNYEIYDKKLLIIMRIFEKWRLECADIFVENSIKILTNHKNLKHFMTFKQLNRKQIKWVEFLAEFNFKIAYRSEIQNIKSNNLTKRSQDFSSNINDHKHKYNHRTLFKIQHFDFDVRKTIEIAFALMNENKKIVVTLTIML